MKKMFDRITSPEKDVNGNLVYLTHFESYLSQYLLEHPEFFKSVYQKIFSWIHEALKLNQKNETLLYNIKCIEKEVRKNHKEFQSIADINESTCLFIKNCCLRLFCEVIQENLIKTIPSKKINNKESFLSHLFHYSMYGQKATKNPIYEYMKPDALYKDEERGVICRFKTIPLKTKNLGISLFCHTPTNLNNYFKVHHEPAQCDFKPERKKSNIGKWFAYYGLPIVSGTSGTARDYLRLLLKIVPLKKEEIKLLMLGLTTTLIAHGHHSFFEVMVALDRYGIKLNDADSLYEFYEQMIPTSITTTDSYKEFKNSQLIQDLFKTPYFRSGKHKAQLLPHVTIGLKNDKIIKTVMEKELFKSTSLL